MPDDPRQCLEQGENAGARYVLGSPRRLTQGSTGLRQASRAGSSLEFRDHREYQPGDDLRLIDWNAFARSDQLTVKLYHEEVNPHLDIVIDGSRSMALENSRKSPAVLGLAAFFATAAANAGYSYRTWVSADGFEPVANGHTAPALWDRIAFNHAGSSSEAMSRKPPRWRPRGIRLFLSDLLWMGDPLPFLGHFAEMAAAVVVVQVLAEADVNPPQRGNLRLIDAETEKMEELFVDAFAVNRYRNALQRHQQNWQQAARQLGVTMTTVIAENVLRDWRLDDLVAAEVLQVL